MPSARVTRFLFSENRAWSAVIWPLSLLQQRVIARQLLEATTAQPVAARIADMGDRNAAAMEDGGDNGGAHAGALGTALCGLVDALVRRGNLLLQQQGGVRQPGMDVHLGKVASRHELGHQPFLDHADGNAACHLAGVVAAHAVGEHGQARAIDEDGVLVVRADHARMGQVRDGECASCRVRHVGAAEAKSLFGSV
jgi:hypothetical protein